MTWVITRLCRDCLDTSCIEVCPVDCTYEYVGPALDQFPIQLYIDPRRVHRLPGVRACLPLGGATARHRGAPVFNDASR
jgi:NAD-dependent dihydropyrimidine dehydrogenase PreA subunit